jgi:hypothetical protein
MTTNPKQEAAESPSPNPEQQVPSILDAYVQSLPSGENAIGIFHGEWSSRLPPPYDKITGEVDLFEDARLTWLADVLGGFRGLRVLELGPLEAGHTTMLERGGAASILAIEGNSRAFLKCLIVKELLELQRSRFVLGDLMSYLRANREHFDLCLASGILYHMQDPIEVLDLISRAADQLLLWTHYYDHTVISSQPHIARKFSGGEECAFDGFRYTRYKYEYGEALQWQGFCGGPKPFSYWLERDDILGMLRRVGYDEIVVGFDQPDHPNGPAFAIVARK